MSIALTITGLANKMFPYSVLYCSLLSDSCSTHREARVCEREHYKYQLTAALNLKEHCFVSYCELDILGKLIVFRHYLHEHILALQIKKMIYT